MLELTEQVLDGFKKMIESGIPFVQRSGAKVDELRRGYVKMSIPYKPNINHIGTMYAGALFTLAELPGGAIFLSSFDGSKYFPIVKAMDLKFVAPAKSDITVEVTLSDDQIAKNSGCCRRERQSRLRMGMRTQGRERHHRRHVAQRVSAAKTLNTLDLASAFGE
ncbi:MAG: YiiD C-terminal domain-containing protein [Polyangiales bacterium]